MRTTSTRPGWYASTYQPVTDSGHNPPTARPVRDQAAWGWLGVPVAMAPGRADDRSHPAVRSNVVQGSPFGVRVWRLLSHRRSTYSTSIEQMRAVVAREAGVPGEDFAAVVEAGVAPDPDLVRRLAPVLQIHTADLFVIAALPVPDDLASAWPKSPWNVGSIVKAAIRMDTDQRGRLEELIRSLPMQPGTGLRQTDNYPDTPGSASAAPAAQPQHRSVQRAHSQGSRRWSAGL